MSLKNTLIELGASAVLGGAESTAVTNTYAKTDSPKAAVAVQFVLGGLTSVALLFLRSYLAARDLEEESETSDTD